MGNLLEVVANSESRPVHLHLSFFPVHQHSTFNIYSTQKEFPFFYILIQSQSSRRSRPEIRTKSSAVSQSSAVCQLIICSFCFNEMGRSGFGVTSTCLSGILILLCCVWSIQCNLTQYPKSYIWSLAEEGSGLQDWEVIRRNFVYYLSGYDDEDRPVWVAEVGKWPTREVVEAGGDLLRNLSKFHDQMGENVLESIEDRNSEETHVTGVTVIIDLENYNISKTASSQTIKYLTEKLMDLNPVARKIELGFLINMSFVSESMINVLRPVLGSVMAQFEIFGTKREKWIPQLLKHIPKSELAHWYGGSKDFKPLHVYG